LSAYFLIFLAVASAASPTMPTFYARRDYIGLDSIYGQVADTNGDGIPDVISSADGLIEVLFGNGDGTFRSGPSSNPGTSGSFSFAATDLNGDGKIDLVFSYGSGIAISIGNGDGTFQSAVYYTTDDGVFGYLVVGDFNNDGILDVATPGAMGVWLFTGKGDGTFNPGVLVVPLQGSDGIAAADFNGDNNLDLVVCLTFGGQGASGNGFVVAFGNGNGTFQTPLSFSEPKRPIAVAAGKLTKNGYPGIAIVNTYANEAALFFSNGAGGFSGPKYVDLPGAFSGGLTIGDLNGDGISALVSEAGYVAYGEGGGNFAKPVGYPIDSAGGTNNVILADLRANGLTDMVTFAYDATSVLLNEGKKQFEDGIWTAVTGGAGCSAAADFNGDGKPDLAVITASGVSILLGTGKAAKPFTTGTPIAISGAACVVSGDLNGDGIPDLLVAVNGSPNALLSYLGNGDGTFTLKSTTPTPNSGGSVILADFNNDGKLDFATSGNLLALGNGDGTFQTPTAIVATVPLGGFSGIVAGDINNDGWPDLVLTNGEVDETTNATILLNNQHGGFTQVPSNFGAVTQQPILADVNGDGYLDLVLAYSTSSGATVYLGNGQGDFTFQVALPGADGSFNAFNIVADINGDGIPDVLVLGYNSFAVYLGEGGATYAPPYYIGLGLSPANNVLVENLHGQAPLAGVPDIVAPDNTGGVMTLLNLTK
jgi:hypothetical protein